MGASRVIDDLVELILNIYVSYNKFTSTLTSESCLLLEQGFDKYINDLL